MLSSPYSRTESFSYAGRARLVIAKQNPDRPDRKYSINVFYAHVFVDGFAITKNYGNEEDLLRSNLLEDEDLMYESFTNLKNGLYEVRGDMYHHWSESYEGDCDYYIELRNIRSQPLSFRQAYYLNPSSINEHNAQLFPDNSAHAIASGWLEDFVINPYMGTRNIKAQMCLALTKIARQHVSASYHDYKISDMKEEDLDNLAFMLQMECDSVQNREGDMDASKVAQLIVQATNEVVLESLDIMGKDYKESEELV
jgi:hypothetical protein